jgi:hypothetical protein
MELDNYRRYIAKVFSNKNINVSVTCIINPCIIRLFISASLESVLQSSHESRMKFWSLFSERSKVQISNGMSEILDWYRCNIAEGGLLDSKNIIWPVASDIAILESKALNPDKHAWEDSKYLIRQFLQWWNWCWRTDIPAFLLHWTQGQRYWCDTHTRSSRCRIPLLRKYKFVRTLRVL